MRRALVLCGLAILIPAAFVVGIMYADYGDNDTAAPATYGPVTIEAPVNLDALLDSKGANTDPIAGYIRIDADGKQYIQWRAGYKLTTPTPKPTATPTVESSPTVDPGSTPTASITPMPSSTPATVPPTATRTPTTTRTAISTPIPTKTPTRTPTGTDDDIFPTPTDEDEPQPTEITGTPPINAVCRVKVQEQPHIMRADHVANATALVSVPKSTELTVQRIFIYSAGTDEWIKATYRNKTGWLHIESNLKYTDDSWEACNDPATTPIEYASATSTPVPTAKPTVGPTSTPIVPVTGCTIYNASNDYKNVREAYTLLSPVAFTIPSGGVADVKGFYTKSSTEKWASIVYRNPITGQELGGWAAVISNGSIIYVLRGNETNGPCSKLPDGPIRSIGPFIRGILMGPHFSWFTQFDYGQLAPLIGAAKCLPLAENICRSLKQINPNIVTIWRDYRVEYPSDYELRVDHFGYAAKVFALVQSGYDYTEPLNEMGFTTEQYQYLSPFLIDVASYLGVRGVCILAPAFGPGWPDLRLRQWNSIVPYLKWANDNPCGRWPDGTPKRHGLSWHASAYYPGTAPQFPWVNDPNIAGNAIVGNQQMKADTGFGIEDFWGPKFVTELGATDIYGGYGTARPSCEENRLMIQRTKLVYSQNPAIFSGGVWWNFGSPGNWIDETRCLPGMFQ